MRILIVEDDVAGCFVLEAFTEGHADSYLVKLREYVKLIQELKKIG